MFPVAALLAVISLHTALVSSAPAYVRVARNVTEKSDECFPTFESCCDIQQNMTDRVSSPNTNTASSTGAVPTPTPTPTPTTTPTPSTNATNATNATTDATTDAAIDASDVYALGHYGPFSATYGYCDLKTDGGGWLVIFRRESELNFHRLLKEYEDGFGELEAGKSFWYGLKSLNHITNRDIWELRVDLVLNEDDKEGVHAHYTNISVGDASEGYVLRLGAYVPEKSTASDSLKNFNGKMFYTEDNDTEEDCAKISEAGWWYSDSCGGQRGGILTSGYNHLRGWYSEPDSKAVAYAHTEMKIRQVSCST